MLVLSRMVGEAIVLPSLGIKFVVVDIRGNKVRVGIEAAPEIPVHRQEVHEAIERQRGGGDEPNPHL